MTLGKLFWLQPDNTIVEFPLKSEQNVIGRGNRCEVRIKHPGISASHALIRITKEATTVEDLGSTNGTRVNGKRVQVHVLRHGDQIGVGRERLMYFAELDDAASFVQPPAIEPYVLPAPIGERVNTMQSPEIKRPSRTDNPLPSADLARVAAPSAPKPLAQTIATTSSPVPALQPVRLEARRETGSKPSTSGSGLELDLGLIAALPMGTSLTQPGPNVAPATPLGVSTAAPASPVAVETSTGAESSRSDPVAMQAPTARRSPAAPLMQAVTASVSVLSGPATGKNYPLEQPSVTLGKEGKQVVEILRAGQTRWQIQQREGATPAYINGDALVGKRELAAGDVIELVGVRLRFDLALA